MTQIPSGATPQPKLVITASRGLVSWLVEQRLSLAFTTYQAGKMFMIGLQPDGKLSVFERTFSRCMGLPAGSDPLIGHAVGRYEILGVIGWAVRLLLCPPFRPDILQP